MLCIRSLRYMVSSSGPPILLLGFLFSVLLPPPAVVLLLRQILFFLPDILIPLDDHTSFPNTRKVSIDLARILFDFVH